MVVLHVEPAEGPAERVEIRDPFVVICGFTGSDRREIAAHMEELKQLGVPPPESTPIFIPVPGTLLRTAGEDVQVASRSTSGEPEPVLIKLPSHRYLLTVGSDHTDRALEADSIEAGKKACPKLVSSVGWPFEEVEGRWDALELSAMVNGIAEPVIEGTLAAITHPTKLIPLLAEAASLPEDRPVVLFLGTLSGAHTPPEAGRIEHYQAELRDPGTGRRLVCAYDIDEPDENSRAAHTREAAR